jgi:hypothetical protein
MMVNIASPVIASLLDKKLAKAVRPGLCISSFSIMEVSSFLRDILHS